MHQRAKWRGKSKSKLTQEAEPHPLRGSSSLCQRTQRRPPEKLWVGPDTANFAQGPAKESEVTVMTGDSILLFYDYDRGEFAWDP